MYVYNEIQDKTKKEKQQWLLKYMFIAHNTMHLIECISFLHTWDS